ncbi:hypothetical protein SAICODRAFT_27257 [Saitoella complicata NRRL Y-17804]|uniref:uncharacterized protein n=1 Tax=Saitoella complicata (strain BCRC 22490 / CBS 7301 / JCM 7358 / NBRC 10748 / NRRL Y-17804) TaxID=698492 RepID=UPI000867AB9C|nr:uncharacterized protein SAICODRAFT_27257 [Saitoella complicata NRRL Y-17804]ODQ50895.1 hypothetical protein SAICODRAFT_27257 [Saitoella complicata NRRL Y-17804]
MFNSPWACPALCSQVPNSQNYTVTDLDETKKAAYLLSYDDVNAYKSAIEHETNLILPPLPASFSFPPNTEFPLPTRRITSRSALKRFWSSTLNPPSARTVDETTYANTDLAKAMELLQTPGATFVAIDVESFEHNHDKLLEFGISTARVPPAQTPITHSTEHYRVQETLSLRNGRYVPDNSHKFNFGRTEVLPLREIIRRIDHLFQDPNVVFVAHDARGDIKYLRDAGSRLDAQKVLVLDTQRVWTALARVREVASDGGAGGNSGQRSLKALCAEIGVENVRDLHNAGNDAEYTMQVFLRMAQAGIEATSKPAMLCDWIREDGLRYNALNARAVVASTSQTSQGGSGRRGGEKVNEEIPARETTRPFSSIPGIPSQPMDRNVYGSYQHSQMGGSRGIHTRPMRGRGDRIVAKGKDPESNGMVDIPSTTLPLPQLENTKWERRPPLSNTVSNYPLSDRLTSCRGDLLDVLDRELPRQPTPPRTDDTFVIAPDIVSVMDSMPVPQSAAAGADRLTSFEGKLSELLEMELPKSPRRARKFWKTRQEKQEEMSAPGADRLTRVQGELPEFLKRELGK